MLGRTLGACLALACATPGAAQAHIVSGTRTLRGLVAEADVVIEARILALEGHHSSSAAPTGDARPAVLAEVVAPLKGELEGPRVRFVQHGHGVAPFELGQDALVFLVEIERSRELSALGRSGEHAWVSLQEHADSYPLTPGNREPLLRAVRAYVASATEPAPEARTRALHDATLVLLGSGDPNLAASALRDLVQAPATPWLITEDVPRLLAVIDDPGTSMGVRVGLLTELDRRGLVDASPHWLRLLDAEWNARDRVTLIRAAGIGGGAPVRPRLVALLGDPDPPVDAAAASSLGTRDNAAAVPPLRAALADGREQVRMAAIRGLGRIAAPEARAALESAATSHPDPATRRRARAELDKTR
jgi:hypothetical protein